MRRTLKIHPKYSYRSCMLSLYTIGKEMSTFRRSLDDEWRRGLLGKIEADLNEFLEEHAKEIRIALKNRDTTMIRAAGKKKSNGQLSDQEMLDLVVRRILWRRGTVHPRHDLEEQQKEIDQEIWYEGERTQGPVTTKRREEIARHWAHLHAARWREWHVMELLYTWEKMTPQIMKLISNTTRRTKTTRKTKTTRTTETARRKKKS